MNLFERARTGDALATECLVTTLRPRLVKMAAYYARCSGEDPEDLLQEAWVGLLEALPVLDTRIGSPEQYLIQHARWRLLDAIKRARVRQCASLEETTLDPAAPAAEETPLAVAWVAEFARCLKPIQRSILSLLLAGCTWREAGKALGCTSANIAYHVRQIRQRYQEMVQNEC